jgi:hypothetical protein
MTTVQPEDQNEASEKMLSPNYKPTLEEKIAVESLLDALFSEYILKNNCEEFV